MNIRIYKILEYTKVEGPGNRFCIWVQGCSKHCPDCFAKETWDKNAGQLFTVNNIYEQIKKQKTKIEGVTFLGGEPFEQAEAVGLLAEKIQNIGLSVLTFTGFNYEYLSSLNDTYVNRLLNNTDLLIDGGFEKDKFDLSRPWVGSNNQNYIFLTNKYTLDILKKYSNKIEMRIDKEGKLFINGMGNFDKIINQLSLRKD